MRITPWTFTLTFLILLGACTTAPQIVSPPVTRVVGSSDLSPSISEDLFGAIDALHRQPSNLKLSIEPLSLLFTAQGQSQTVRVIARDSNGKLVKLKKNAVTWRISEPSVANISLGSGNKDGLKGTELEEGTDLEASTNRDKDENAITVKSLTDQGFTTLTATLSADSTSSPAEVPVEVHRLKPSVKVVPANRLAVGITQAGPGGGFGANEIAASRSGTFPASAVVRDQSLTVNSLVNLEGPRGGLGRVVSLVRRGEFSLVQLDYVGPEAVLAPYDFTRRIAFTADNVPPSGLRAQAGAIVPVPGFDVSLCKVISGASGIDLTKLISFEEFKPNLDPRIIESSDGSSRKIGFAVGINPTGKVKISPTQALVGEGNPLKLKVRCSIDNLPTLPFIITFAIGPVPIVIPTFFQAKPNFTFTVDATKVADLQLSAMLDDSPIYFQTAAKITNFIPTPLPFAVKAPGDETGINWATYRTKFKYDFSLVTGLANGFVPAKLALEVLPVSVNIAWYLGLAAQPQLALDFVNADVTALKSVLAWANGPFAAESKSGEGRRNIAYLSLKLAVSSNNLDQYTDQLPIPAAGKVIVKNILKTISSKISGSAGENFGEANHLPLKPGELKGDLPGFAAALQVLDAEGNEITRVPLKGDGSAPVSIEAGNRLRLLVQPELGDPEVGKDLLNLAGVKLAVTNKERFESLPILGNVWDYTNKDLVDPSGNTGPFIKFSLNGKSGLYPNSGLLVPVNPPDVAPVPLLFRMGGELLTVSQDLCKQIAKKGSVEWRFTAENKLISQVSSSSYIGGATVSCGLEAEFYAGGSSATANKLVADGQEVLVDDCDLATPFGINFTPKAEIKNLKAKLDGVLYKSSGGTLAGGSSTLLDSTRIFASSGPHTLTAEATDAGGKLKTLNRTFNIKCKETLMPAGPLTLSVIDDYRNTVELVNAETILTKRLCGIGATQQFELRVSASFRANENPNSQQLSVAGMSIDARDDVSLLPIPAPLGFTQLGVIYLSGPGLVKLPEFTLPDPRYNARVNSFRVGTGVSLRGTGLAELSVPPFTKATATVVNKHITINYINLPATDNYCQPRV